MNKSDENYKENDFNEIEEGEFFEEVQFEQTTIANLNIVRSLTNTLGGGIKKSLGQNFLVNQKSLLKFIDSIKVTKEDTVIEIGPGIGVVSYTLCERAKKVYLIEIDKEKEAALKKVLENYSNYEVIWADATTFDYNEFVNNLGIPVKLIGSLPYSVGKRIIYQILSQNFNWSEASFFLQREVAESYTSNPPKAEFLGMFAQVFSDVRFAFAIPPEHFYPMPKVKTGVVHMKRVEKFTDINTLKLSDFIKIGFTQPRKTLLNNLKSQGVTAEMLLEIGLKVTARPSELSVENWYQIFKSKINS